MENFRIEIGWDRGRKEGMFFFIFFLIFLLSSFKPDTFAGPNYDFHGRITESVLKSYLGRAVTMAELCTPPEYKQDGNSACLEDDIRLILTIEAKFIGRAMYRWGSETALKDPRFFGFAEDLIKRVHETDDQVIFQAGIFEVVTPEVEQILIPEHVFRAFELPVQIRPFNFPAMLFEDGLFVNHFDKASVPDITRIETKLWFYYLATRYIDTGFEALHWGQIDLTGIRDQQWENWFELMGKVREYANKHSRRKFVLNDAHTSVGYIREGKHLLDFLSYPLRIQESEDTYFEGVLKVDYSVEEQWQKSIYQKTKGGLTPSGWTCDRMPYLVEFDNFEISSTPGKRSEVTDPFIWGYDEITWFSLKDIEDQKKWLEYAYRWIKQHDLLGHLQMPVTRVVVDGESERHKYKANIPGNGCKQGTGLEEKIKELWSYY
jgi:hypothetical protein